jgi:large subunit ribosomal protein L13
MKTYVAKKEEIKEKWYLMDAQGKFLGRLATRTATLLIGKDQATYTPHVKKRVHVVIINAKGILLSGKKTSQKVYQHYSGYPGGRKTYTFKELMDKKPTEIVRRAIKGMLPKNRLGDQMLKGLRIFEGSSHDHQAQKPVEIKL